MNTNPIPVRHPLCDNRWDLWMNVLYPDRRSLIYCWCWDNFGHPGTDPETGVKSAWDYNDGYIYFFDEKCVTMYILKWG